MKIGLSTPVIQRGKTGIAQYVFALVRALADCAPQCRLTLFVLEEDLPLFSFADRAEVIPIPEKFRPPLKNILWHQTALPRLIRKHDLDLIHIPSYRRLLWSAPCPRVATIHDLAPFRVRKKYDWVRMLYGRVVVRRLAHGQEAIIAISQNTARDIERFFKIPADRVTVIHNGLEHDRFAPGNQEEAKSWARQRFGLTGPFILYVARLEHPAKNHWRLIEAFNRLKKETPSNWKLVLAGSDWNGAEQIHAAIKQSPFKDEIKSLGFVSDDELPRLYRAAEIFAYPSLYEGFGLPPVEAMACGCPVISSTAGSLEEVVGDAALKIVPEEMESIHQALTQMVGSGQLRDEFRLKGFQQAARFNWKKTALATAAVYEKVLRAPQAMTSPAAARP